MLDKNWANVTRCEIAGVSFESVQTEDVKGRPCFKARKLGPNGEWTNTFSLRLYPNRLQLWEGLLTFANCNPDMFNKVYGDRR